MERLEKIPVPVIATFLSFLTLGNVYGGLGFVWLRYLIMALGTIFIICYILKIVMYPKTCLKEYDQTIPSSLYAAFCMVLMVLGRDSAELSGLLPLPSTAYTSLSSRSSTHLEKSFPKRTSST